MLRWLRKHAGREAWPASLISADYADAGVRRTLRTFAYAVVDPVEDKLPLVQAAMLVVRGARDRIVPQEWAEEVTRLLPRGRLTVIPGPHTSNFAAPGALAEAVRPFLAEERTTRREPRPDGRQVLPPERKSTRPTTRRWAASRIAGGSSADRPGRSGRGAAGGAVPGVNGPATP